MEINTPIQECTVDSIDIDQNGLLCISGWYPYWDKFPEIIVSTTLKKISCLELHRCSRPDVAIHLVSDNNFYGYQAYYRLYDLPENSLIEVSLFNIVIWRQTLEKIFAKPHYEMLLDSKEVFHRDDIYGYGPPIDFVPEDIKHLTKLIHGKILDFGCGSGVLVKYLRDNGNEAFGIEINRPEIGNAIKADLLDYITLYDGNLPLPYSNNQFDYVTAIEVIEHIPRYEEIIYELSRVASKGVVITVPDISAIPKCFQQNVVPWHLLESTHFNFFNQNSLEAVLSKYFTKVHLIKIGRNCINQSNFFTSIVAVCEHNK